MAHEKILNITCKCSTHLHLRNENQSYNEVSLYSHQKGHHKMSTNNKDWRGCREQVALLHCWWECNLVQPLWRTVWRFVRKTKSRVAVWSYNPTPGHVTQENPNSKRHMHPNVHSITTTITKTWKQPIEYYSVIKKEWNNAICSNRDGPGDYHTKQSKPDIHKCHVISLIRGIKRMVLIYTKQE